jgi:DNA topoisomerase-1
MSAAKYTVVDVSVSSPSLSRSYKYIVETPVFLGWRKLEARDSADLTGEQATDSGMLFYLEQIATSDKPVTWSLIESKVAMDSRAPAHYTEASLIQKLEDLGIGRPSTFSTIVETIQDRGYAKKTNIAGIRQQCVEWKLRSIPETKSKECEETPENCVRRSLRNADATNIERIETERIFGEEKDKLVIQPTGELVLEFLVKHFDDCFSYGYTKSMEDELDVVASQSSEKAMAEWFQICRRCFDDISERSKPLARQTKQTFALADTSDYVLIFNSYGASLKRVGEEVEYAKVRPDATIELEKAKRGEYTAAELIWREDNGCLGTYQNAPVYLKKGKYGLYAEYGNKETVNLKSVDKSPDSITLNDVVAVIKSKSVHVMSESAAAAMFLPCSELEPCENPTKEGYGVNAPETSKAIIRALRPDLSIRKGKYGPYIFHKTAAMSKPEFYALKPIIKKWQEMADLELIAWIENTYRVNI